MTARNGLCLAVLAAFLPAGAALAESDADVLKGLHAKVIQAHREINVELILEDDAQEYVVANRGEITRPTPRDGRWYRVGNVSNFRE